MIEANKPFISICVPQYERIEYLCASIRALSRQTFRDYEICIYDDASQVDTLSNIKPILEEASIRYNFQRSDVNCGYDHSLRSAILLAQGRYILLMGNDDKFSRDDALEKIVMALSFAEEPAIGIVNYLDDATGKKHNRSYRNKLIQGTPYFAARLFRKYSFVGGLIYKRDLVQRLNTDRHDGSEMYQMYLSAALTSAGGSIVFIDEYSVSKDIYLDQASHRGSFASKNIKSMGFFSPIRLPMVRIMSVVHDGIKTGLPSTDASKFIYPTVIQLYGLIYPYWLYQYKKSFGAKVSFNVLLGVLPLRRNIKIKLGILNLIIAWTLVIITLPFAMTARSQR